MSDLKILIHNLADLAPDYDRRHHYRVVDIMVEHWSEQHYITYNYAEKKTSGSDPQRYAFFQKLICTLNRVGNESY